MAQPRDDAAEEAPLAGALPVPVTPLVGRDQEAAGIVDLVVRDGMRLITLTGPGGVGKDSVTVTRDTAARYHLTSIQGETK